MKKLPKVLDDLIAKYRNPQRWHKAMFNLDSQGRLSSTPKDIGPIIDEVMDELKFREQFEIKNELFKALWPHIAGGVVQGLPEWYKVKLGGQPANVLQLPVPAPVMETERIVHREETDNDLAGDIIQLPIMFPSAGTNEGGTGDRPEQA